KVEANTLQINDGKYAYAYQESEGHKEAYKQDNDPKQSLAISRSFFESLEKEATLKVMADETIDGKPAWIIEATPKPETAEPNLGKMTFAFLKDNGILVRIVVGNTAGEPMQTIEYKNINADAKIDPERFVFKAP